MRVCGVRCSRAMAQSCYNSNSGKNLLFSRIAAGTNNTLGRAGAMRGFNSVNSKNNNDGLRNVMIVDDEETGERKSRFPDIDSWDGTGMPPLIQLPKLSENFDEGEFEDYLLNLLPLWESAWKVLSPIKVDMLLAAQDLDDAMKLNLNFEEVQKKKKIPNEIGPDGKLLPLPRVRNVDKNGVAYGLGRRKRGIASVWIREGTGKFKVNSKSLFQYFPREDHRLWASEPLLVTKQSGKFDINCLVHGGGHTGQAGAIRLGVARALQNFDPKHRLILKPLGMMTRDRRVVEEKKPGKVKARKSFQWVKR